MNRASVVSGAESGSRWAPGAAARGAAPPGRRISRPQPGALPAISALRLRWFTWYCRGYLRRHFHALRLSRAGEVSLSQDGPLVLYSNHASWWDPLLALVLKDALFPERPAYAPIDAGMLARYRVFRKLGFFGIDSDPRRGAVQFLRAAETILRDRRSLLLLTPQGRFADVRERPVRFRAGVGHLAARVPGAVFVPVAVEYVHWEERLPEILVRFGEPVRPDLRKPACFDPEGWLRLLEEKLILAQDSLAIESQRRCPADFHVLLRGRAGIAGVYDLWRRGSAWWRCEVFHPTHGDK